jgi:hypothetical protein
VQIDGEPEQGRVLWYGALARPGLRLVFALYGWELATWVNELVAAGPTTSQPRVTVITSRS